MSFYKINFGSRLTHYLISALLLSVYSFISFRFTWHDNLTSFASDSANYMLMAQYLSPWSDPSQAIIELWPAQYLPPLFPLLLALTGAAHSYTAAHILTTSLLIISLPLLYVFAKQCFASKWQALFIALIFAISPSTWINMLGILSENLYLLISLLILILAPKIKQNNIYISIVFGCLIASLILTRTIGASMLAAYIVIGFIMWKKSEIKSATYFIPISLAMLINIGAKLLHQSSIPTLYFTQLKELTISGNPQALIEAWFTAWQLYWLDSLLIPYSITLTLGIFACFGLLIRLRMLKLDAVYVFIYISILLVWPYPGQTLRFIYPIQGLSLIYAFYFITTIHNHFVHTSPRKSIMLSLLLTAMVVVPPLSFLFNRYVTGMNSGHNHIMEYYRFPDLKIASANAAIQMQMFRDFERIHDTTNTDDIIMYFEPTYVALLSNRISKSITFSHADGLYTLNDSPGADYIYISRIHPRKTREGINGLDIQAHLKDYADIQWTGNSLYNNDLVSIFLKIKN